MSFKLCEEYCVCEINMVSALDRNRSVWLRCLSPKYHALRTWLTTYRDRLSASQDTKSVCLWLQKTMGNMKVSIHLQFSLPRLPRMILWREILLLLQCCCLPSAFLLHSEIIQGYCNQQVMRHLDWKPRCSPKCKNHRESRDIRKELAYILVARTPNWK